MSAANVLNKTGETVDSASAGAHDVVDRLENAANRSIESGRQKANDAIAKLEDLEAGVELTLEEASLKVSRYVQEKPLQAAGIAFAAGVLTTMILRRR